MAITPEQLFKTFKTNKGNGNGAGVTLQKYNFTIMNLSKLGCRK